MSETTRLFIFETAFGWTGFVRRGDAIARLSLPEADRGTVERRLRRFAPDALPAQDVESDPAVEPIRRYFQGEPVDFSAVPIDLDAIDDFGRAVYAALRKVGRGAVTSYGELAALAGYPGLAREVGQAMGANPVPLIIPCHRVLAAGGKLGGFSGPGGPKLKARMLTLEGYAAPAGDQAQAAFAF